MLPSKTDITWPYFGEKEEALIKQFQAVLDIVNFFLSAFVLDVALHCWAHFKQESLGYFNPVGGEVV